MTRATFEIANMRHPSQGAKAMPVDAFNFATTNIFSGNFLIEMESGHIDIIQSVFIDNSQNENQFTLAFPGMGQNGFRIVVAPFTQGFYPVTVPTGILAYEASSLAGEYEVPVILYNIPMPYFVWAVQAAASGGTISANGNDVSGTIAAPNVSQVVFAANGDAQRRVIQNPSANVASIFVAFNAAATENEQSQEILPGQSLDTGGGPMDKRAWEIISPSAQPFTAIEYA